jgi:hypothetical protein
MSAQQAPAHLVQHMQEKRQELDQLLIVRQLSTHLQTHFDELSDKFDGLIQGNQGNNPPQSMMSPGLPLSSKVILLSNHG